MKTRTPEDEEIHVPPRGSQGHMFAMFFHVIFCVLYLSSIATNVHASYIYIHIDVFVL